MYNVQSLVISYLGNFWLCNKIEAKLAKPITLMPRDVKVVQKKTKLRTLGC